MPLMYCRRELVGFWMSSGVDWRTFMRTWLSSSECQTQRDLARRVAPVHSTIADGNRMQAVSDPTSVLAPEAQCQSATLRLPQLPVVRQ